MARSFMRVLCLILAVTLIPPVLLAKPKAKKARATTEAAAEPQPAPSPSPPQQATGARKAFGPSEEPLNPQSSLLGYPGLWKVIGAGGLPAKSFGGVGWIDRIGRNPGYLTITTAGTSGFVSLHPRFALDWQINANRRILVRRADQLSFGQQNLVALGKAGCPEPNCFPWNLKPIVLLPGTSIPQLRLPHTGALTDTAGFYNEFPWANHRLQTGFGEVNLGAHINLVDFTEERKVALAVRPHFSIPTKFKTDPTASDSLLNRGIQTGSYKIGADLLIEGRGRDIIGVYINAGYTYVSSPESVDLYDQVPLRFGINIPRTSRVQFLLEYGADFFVGSGTRNRAAGSATDGTGGFRVYPTPWLALSAGYRHTLNHSQYGGDKNGFVATISATHIPVEAVAAPVPPTVTCTAEPTVVRPGDSVKLTATATTTVPGAVLTYTWSTTAGRIEGTGPTVRLDTTGLTPGTYSATVRVDDGKGGFADCTVQVTLQAPPPPPPPKPPVATCSADRTTVAPGEAVTLTARASSPDNRPLNYDWTVTGGRIQGSGATVRWDTTGLSGGTYTATVRVTDDRGLSADCSVTITVQPPPPAPRAAKLNECQFRRNSPRVDNVCKAVLDDVALRLQNEPESRAAVIGYKGARERPADLAVRRASNVKAYLVHTKGIDAGRIEVRTGTEDASKVEIWLIPRGASVADVPGAPAAEKMPPPPRVRKKAPAKKVTGEAPPAEKAPAAKKGAAKKE